MSDSVESKLFGCFPLRRRSRMSSDRLDERRQSGTRRMKRLERLVGLTLVIMMRYAVPKAQAIESCNIDEIEGSDELYPPPRLKCQQGFFNKETGRCNCDFGWSGPLCDSCLEEPCVKKSRITDIQPQSGLISSTPIIQFIGHGFPRTAENSYHCVFNTTKVAGKWISPLRIDCMRPQNISSDESYTIALIPNGLQRVIRYYEEIYFDFYEPCSNCPETCLQNLCVCKAGKIGELCDEIVQLIPDQCTSENLTETYNITEFRPFSALIVSNKEYSSSLTRASNPGIQIDPINGLLLWEKPIGSNQVHFVEYAIQMETCTEYIHADIFVPPIYQPRFTSVTKHKQSNLHRVAGYIKFNGSNEAANHDLPVVLSVYHGEEKIEDIFVESRRRFFAYDIYPYTGSWRDHLIFAEHPNLSTNSTPGLSFSVCVIKVDYEKTLIFGDTTLLINYSVKSDACACGEWSIQVLWPRELIRVHSQHITGQTSAPNIQLVLSLDQTSNIQYDEMFVSINCDSAATFTAKHTLIYKPLTQLKIYPEKIQLLIDPNRNSAYVEVNIESSGQPLHADMRSNNISPFFLVNTPTLQQIDNITTKITYLFGVRNKESNPTEGTLKYPSRENPIFMIPYKIEWTEELPEYNLFLTINCLNTVNKNEYAEITISTDTKDILFTKPSPINSQTKIQLPSDGVYEMLIESENFFSLMTLVRINSLNTTLNVQLEQRPTKYLALSGEEVSFVDSGVIRPELTVQPNVITEFEETVWITFVYKTGPQNSMAMIKVESVSIGEYQITNLPVNMGISVGSGYRHKVQLIFSQTLESTNNVQLFKIPYTYTIPGLMKDFEDTFSIAFDFRKNKNQLSQVEPITELVARSTKIYEDCTPNLLKQCRLLFKRVDLCSDPWEEHLTSHVPSMQAFMQAVLFKRDCRNMGIRQEEIMELLRCLISANIGLCQVENKLNNAMLKCTQKSPSLYVQSNLFNQLAKSLNLSRFDLCRFFNNFYRQLFYLNKLIPPNVSLQRGDIFDKFLATVSNVSDVGEFITLTESTTIQNSTYDMLFITNWNRLHEELDERKNVGNSENIKSQSPKPSIFELLSAYLETIRELNFLSKKIADTNPPNLMNDLLTSLLKNIETSPNIVMIANVNVEPKCLRESQEFQVHLQLQNPTVNTTVKKIELRIRFQGSDSSRVNYSLKPVMYNGQVSDDENQVLKAGQNLSVLWKVTPTFDFRLTRNLIQMAIIGISFQIDGKRRWQEAQSNSFQIGPAETLRTLVFLYPNVTNKVDENSFSARISVMNIGYSTIKNVHLIQIRPDMSNAEMNGPLEFSLDGVQVDNNNQYSNTLDINLGDLKSAESRQVYLNFSTSSQQGFFRNLSFICTSNNRLLDGYSNRQFYIRKQIQHESFLVSELSDIYQLYHYQADQLKLTPLNSAFFTQESSIQTSDNCYSSIVQAFQLADDNKKFDSPLVGSSQWPKAINLTSQLVAIFQVFPNFDVMQRVVAPGNIWLSYGSNEQKEVNFIDLRPFTSASKIYYELVFARNECKTDLSFLQREYHIPYPAEALSKYSIVSQIQAIAPRSSSSSVIYKLLSPEQNLPFAILAENGAIIFMNSTSIDDRPHCAILVSEDLSGRTANATIQLGGSRQINCSKIDVTSTLFQHVLGGAHNLPFDYNEARSEFLNNSLSARTTISPVETTTEMPGDEWTEEGEISTIYPQSTLKQFTTTTTESVLLPDSTLTTINLPKTTLPSIGPDNHPSTTEQTQIQISPEQNLLTTTSSVQVANILPTLYPSITTENNDILVDLITTSILPIIDVTGTPINKNITFNNKSQSDNKVTSAEMVDMACKTKNQKPMMQVLCDLAKSVYKTNP